MATLRDTALPAQGNTSWYGHYTALDEDVRRTNVGVVQADSFAGANDGAKLQTALTWAAAQTYRPWVQFPARLFSVGSQTYQTYSGMRLCGPGASEGARNPEQGTALTTHQVQFTATMTNGSQPRVRWSSGAVETLPAFANGASGPVRTLTKAGALAANDFAGICAIGSLAVDTTNGKLYICTATNGTTTSTWVVVGTQT